MVDYIYRASEAIGYKKGMARSSLKMTAIMLNKGNYSAAFKNVNRAEVLVNELNNDVLIARAATLKANYYICMGFMEESKKCLNKAIISARRIKDNDGLHLSMATIYRVYANLIKKSKSDKGTDSIFFYLKKSYQEHRKIKNLSYQGELVIVSAFLGQYYIETKEYDSAKYYLDTSLHFALKKNFRRFGTQTFIGLGYLDYKEKKYQSAISNYQQALTLAKVNESDEEIRDVYIALSNAYDEIDDIFKSKYFFKKYVSLSESIKKKDQQSITTLFDFIKLENEKIYRKKENMYMFISVVILALFVIGLLSVILFFFRFLKEKKHVEDKAFLLEKKVKEADSETERKRIDNEELKTLITLAQTNDPSFFIKFQSFDPEFIKKLLEIAPNLIASELELSAFLRLNFETKEIARYTNASVRSVQAKKHRIRKKLKIPITEDISIWIAKL